MELQPEMTKSNAINSCVFQKPPDSRLSFKETTDQPEDSEDEDEESSSEEEEYL